MPRGEKRGNREAKKPKKPKAKAPAAESSFAAVQKRILEAAARKK